MRRLARRFGLAKLAFDPSQGIPQRLHHLLHCGAPAVKFSCGPGIGGAQPALCHFDECPRAPVKSLGRYSLESRSELAVDERSLLSRAALHYFRALLRSPATLFGGCGAAGQVSDKD